MDWSNEARRVVAATLAGLPAGSTIEEKRKALRAAYPFGPREYWPYKAWCNAVRAALGMKAKKPKTGKAPKDKTAVDEMMVLFGDMSDE